MRTPARQAAPDVIADLVAHLASTPMWNNGLAPALDLPSTAPPDEVVGRVFQTVSFDSGRVTRHTILEVREVRIGQDPSTYTAVRVRTDQGDKVVLIRYEGPAVGWWGRVYG